MVGEMRKVYGEGTDITSEDMSLTSGCNLAFVATIMTLADAGDEVILPVPWFVLAVLSIWVHTENILLGILTISNGFRGQSDLC